MQDIIDCSRENRISDTTFVGKTSYSKIIKNLPSAVQAWNVFKGLRNQSYS